MSRLPFRSSRRPIGAIARITALALPLALALTAVAPDPAPSGDRVSVLAGTWTCTTIRGSRTHNVGMRKGNEIDIASDVRSPRGSRFELDDRYTYDARADLWHGQLGGGTGLAIDAFAPPWTGSTWDLVGRDRSGRATRVKFELLPDGMLRRTIARETTPSSGEAFPSDGELCARGDEPPPPGTCLVPNVAPYVVSIVRPSARDVPIQTPHGTVVVAVQLDEKSQVVSAAIQSSPSAVLDRYALAAAHTSQFQTELRDCKPRASNYLFSLTYGR